jgi:hypothetical protein
VRGASVAIDCDFVAHALKHTPIGFLGRRKPIERMHMIRVWIVEAFFL